jgi:uncharacterized membrane protein YesL
MTDKQDEKKPAAPSQPEQQEITPFTVLGSVFRSWFGVQTEKNRQRDFSSNNPTPFIIAGIIFVIAMVVGVIIVVNIALSTAGK